MDLKVGFIGLGNQGAPIARHIIEAGFPTTLWARRPESLAAFASTPAKVASSAAELAAGSDLVGVCVWDDVSVRDVLHGDEGVFAGARPGTIVAVHSTVRPDTCTALAAEAAERGVVLIDAPVSGGPLQSAEGRLLVMMGGPTEVVERCRPVFETFGGMAVLHLGDVGAAQLAKLVNNTLFAANQGLVASALEVGGRLGIDTDRMLDVIINGSGRSFGAEMIKLRRDTPNDKLHRRGYLDKDVPLLVETARSMGADPTSTVVDVAGAWVDTMRAEGI